MGNCITKDDLKALHMVLLRDIGEMLKQSEPKTEMSVEWLRSKAIRHLMDMSPGTLQNLRITGKIRFKKIMGSYYYNKSDVLNLFEQKL